MFNNIEEKINGEDGFNENKIINQFMPPLNTEDHKPKRDSIKTFLIILTIITVIIAVLSIFYTKVLEKQVEVKKQELSYFDTDPALNTFKSNLPEMRNLSQRLKLVNSVYDNKIYISSMLFPIIESLVESSRDSYVYFNSFNLKRDASGNFVSISLSGEALDYPTLYRQINRLKNNEFNKYMTNVKMISMSLNEDNHINFSVSFDMNIFTKSFFEYVKNSIASSTIKNSNPGPLFKLQISSDASTTNVSTTSSTTVDIKNNN